MSVKLPLALVSLISTLLVASAAPAHAATDWTKVSAGTSHTCGIRGVGKLYCWGRNNVGQLGDGSTSPRSVPTQIGTAKDWTRISAANAHTCGVRAGALFCWGSDANGKLGDGDNGTLSALVPVTSPKQVGTATNWTSVSTGDRHTCGLRSTGRLYCWGDGTYWQIGDGAQASYTSPKSVGSASDWKVIEAGSLANCGIRGVGTLYCWGYNEYGEAGDGTRGEVHTPKALPASDWTTVETGSHHTTCAIRAGGKLYCWGDQPGDGSGGSLVPKTILGKFLDWRSAATGDSHHCAIRGPGKLYCWGNNGAGQLGIGTTAPTVTPTAISSAFEDWKAVTAGGTGYGGFDPGVGHTCAIRTSGRLYCWGDNVHGQLGNGNKPNDAYAPSFVSVPFLLGPS